MTDELRSRSIFARSFWFGHRSSGDPDPLIQRSSRLSRAATGRKALSLAASGLVIILDPVTHTTQFLHARGEPTRERQNLSLVFDKVRAPTEAIALHPGPLRLSLENRTDMRVLPGLWIAGDKLEQLLSRRKPFLTAKRLLTNQVFRDIYGTDTIDVDQRLKITSLTFLFTDLRGSTELSRAGRRRSLDLVRSISGAQRDVAAEAGAVVKTSGDAVMATFPTPDRAVAAALRMRQAMRDINTGRSGAERSEDGLMLKIGIHEGPCLAVVLDSRQDYFGRTVNIAARVQALADSRSLLATSSVVTHPRSSTLLETNGLKPLAQQRALRGVTEEMAVYEIP
jgi:class 3 adenylate cyclase